MGIKAQDFAATIEKAYADKWGYIWATSGESWTEIIKIILCDKCLNN